MPKILLAVLTAALIGAAPASAAKIKTGVYDCYAYDAFSGFAIYKGSVKFKGGGKYEHAWGRKGTKFEDKTTGKYKVKGKKIKFKGGAMKHTPGRITSKTTFDVWVDGENSGIYCGRDKNP